MQQQGVLQTEKGHHCEQLAEFCSQGPDPVVLSLQGKPARVVVVSSSAHAVHPSPMILDDLHYKKSKYAWWGAYGEPTLLPIHDRVKLGFSMPQRCDSI